VLNSQNFDETFLDMEPVVKDVEEDGEQTGTDHSEGEDSVATSPQSHSPSVHEADVVDQATEAQSATHPAEVAREGTKPAAERLRPTKTTEPSAPTKRSSAEVPRPSVSSQKSGTPKPEKLAVPPKYLTFRKRRERPGIVALDKRLGDGIDECTGPEAVGDQGFAPADVSKKRSRSK